MAADIDDIAGDLSRLGLGPGQTVMVHASLSALGPIEGGPGAVVDALLRVLGPDGTLVMPAFRTGPCLPGIVHKAGIEVIRAAQTALPPYDPAATPSEMGAVAEAFRRRPGVLRSPHPTMSVAALGPRAAHVVAPHALAWAQGPESPLERLHAMDARCLLLGVGFGRLSMLHYAEFLVPHGRRKTRAIPGEIGVLLTPDVGDDDGDHFPEIGRAAMAAGIVATGPVGAGTAHLVGARAIVALARDHLDRALA